MERLTLEEAIKHAKEVADMNYNDAEKFDSNDSVENYMKANCMECAEQHEKLAKWLEELKSYKNAEEQGLLVRLPNDLDRILYQINYEYTECTEYGEERNKCEIYDCNCECDSVKKYYIAEVEFQYIFLINYYERFGKTLFFTREEAEKKLEEIKDGRKKSIKRTELR